MTEPATPPTEPRAKRETGGMTDAKKKLIVQLTAVLAALAGIITPAYQSCEAHKLAEDARATAATAGVQAQTAAAIARTADREQESGYQQTRKKLDEVVAEADKLRSALDDCLKGSGAPETALRPPDPALKVPLPATAAEAVEAAP